MSRERILVVDDEPQIQRFLRPALEAAGYDVVEAMTGAQALKAVVTTAPALVILDLGLPDMDGKEVIGKLRGWSQVPILILSARDQETEKIAALDLGADDYVEKPFGIGELVARMRTALRHRIQETGELTGISVDGLASATSGMGASPDLQGNCSSKPRSTSKNTKSAPHGLLARSRQAGTATTDVGTQRKN